MGAVEILSGAVDKIASFGIKTEEQAKRRSKIFTIIMLIAVLAITVCFTFSGNLHR